MIPKYPKIIPELDLSGKNQTQINRKSFKKTLLSIFFHKRIEKDNLIYLKKSFSNKLHFMALFTMTKSLAFYNDYTDSGNPNDKDNFIKIAEKLIDMSNESGWRHDNFSQLPGYPKKFNSYSCLVDGRGIGVLIRYYQFNQSGKARKLLTNILANFEVESDKGGVLRPDGFFLEYSWGNNSPVVWNGLMSALIGLHDCYLYGPEEVKPKAQELYEMGMDKFSKCQDQLFWEEKLFSWIRYDDNKMHFADGMYINIETRQLKYLSDLDKRLKPSYEKILKIKSEYSARANLYENYYFIKKRIMK
jgi:hypothetical protein